MSEYPHGEDMHGPIGDTHEVVVANQALLSALLAAIERDSPGTLGSVAKTAIDIVATTIRDQPQTQEMAIAHINRLAGQATRLLRRAEGSG